MTVLPAETTATDPVRAHHSALWRYLRMHGAPPSLAEDLVQEAFVVALRKGALEFEPAATFAFLQRTARFLFLRSLRRRAAGDVALADAVDELWDRDCGDGGEELVARVRECVGQLGERARRAIESAYGLNGDDADSRARIAGALGLRESGLKTLLQRAREALRTCLERKRSGHE